MKRVFVTAVPLLLAACEGDLADGAGGATTGTAAAQTGSVASSSQAVQGSSQTGTLPEAVGLALHNVVRDATWDWPMPNQPPAVLHRVEIPPRTTLQATVADEIVAVRFSLDGVEVRLDDERPFFLDEDTDGKALPWSLDFGAHEIVVDAYTDAAGTGAPQATRAWTFELSDLGMAPGFVELSEDDNDAWTQSNIDDVMEARSFEGSQGTLPYRIFVPEDYDAGVKYPVLVYLHGRGQRGSDNPPSLYSSRLFRGPRSIVSPNFRHAFPAIVLVPQCSNVPEHHEWAHWIGNSEDNPFAGLGSDGSYMQHPDPWSSAQHVFELVGAIGGELSIDPDRVYLTGESMGGFGTWELTTRWPETWAAGIPMAGFSDRTKVNQILRIPFWVFHGDADSSNPVAGSRAMVAAIEAAGGEVIYTEYPDTEHGPTFDRAWTQEPELLPWIFSQRRPPPVP